MDIMSSYLPTLIKDLWAANPEKVTQYLQQAKYYDLKSFANLDGDIEEPEEEEERIFLDNMMALGPDESSTLCLLRNASKKCLEWLGDGCDDSTMSILFKYLTYFSKSIRFNADDQKLNKFKAEFPLALLFALTSDESFQQWTSQVVAMSAPRRIATRKAFRHNAVDLMKWASLVWRKFESSRVEGFETDYTDYLLSSGETASSTSCVVSSDQSGGSEFTSDSHADYIYTEILNIYKRPKYDSIFIEALFTHCGSVAESLISCAYHRHIRYPPSPQTYDTWIRAVHYREAGDDQSADQCVKLAFETEFWLPLRYAALFSFKPLFPILLPRIEYEAVLTIANVNRRIVPDNIFNIVYSQCNSKSFNPQNTNSTIWWNQACTHAGNVGCCNFIPCGTPVCSMKHRLTYEQDIPNMSILPESPKNWDPSIWAIGILYWKLPDNSFYFEKNSSTELSYGIDKFEAVSPEMIQMFNSIYPKNSILKQDIYQSTHSLYNIRNNAFRTSKPITLVDSWEAIMCALTFCHVAKKQAEKWTYHSSGDGVDFPPEQLVASLSHSAESSMQGLHAMLSTFIPPSLVTVQDDYKKFMCIFHEIKCDSPVSMLLCPPDNEEGYSGSFAGIPWTSVLDLCDSPQSSPSLWSTMIEAIGQGSFIPGRNNHLRAQSKFSGEIDSVNVESLLLQYTAMSPLGLPWFQPLLDSSGVPRVQFSNHSEDAGSLQPIRDDLQKVMDAILQKAALSTPKELVIVIPLHGLYSFPIITRHSGKLNNCTFIKEFPPNDISNKDKRSANLNYSFGQTVHFILQYITNGYTNVRRRVVLLVDSTPDDTMTSFDWIHNAINGDTTDVIPLNVPPHMFDMLFKFSFGDFSQTKKDMICIYSGADVYPLSKKYKPLHNVVDNEVYPPDLSLEMESRLNLGKLKNAGLNLLYTQLTQDCLRNIANALNEGGSVSIGNVENDHVLPSLYKCTLNFSVGGVADWPIFDKSLTDPFSMSAVVVQREVSSVIEKEALKLWQHAAIGHHVNMLTLLCDKGCGGSTLLRRFAFEIAFKSWGAAVLEVSSTENSQGVLSGVIDLLELCQAIASRNDTTAGVKPLIFVVDRGVSELYVQELLRVLKSTSSRGIHVSALVVRIQRREDLESDPPDMIAMVTMTSQIEIPPVTSSECGAVRDVIQSICGDDFSFHAVSRNPLVSRRIFGMISLASKGESHESDFFKGASEEILAGWVNEFVKKLYEGVLSDKDSPGRSSLMAVLFIAIAQVSAVNFNGLSPFSLLPILDSRDLQSHIYGGVGEYKNGLYSLEENVLKLVFANIYAMQTTCDSFCTSLIPFFSIFEETYFAEFLANIDSFVSTSNQFSRMIGTKFKMPDMHSERVASSRCIDTDSDSIANFIRSQLKPRDNFEEDLLDNFLITSQDGKLLFTSDAVAERLLDVCMNYELELMPQTESCKPLCPYYVLTLHFVNANMAAPESYGEVLSCSETKVKRGQESLSIFRHMFATHKNKSCGSALPLAWIVDKVNKYHEDSVIEHVFSDNKVFLLLLSGLALFPCDAEIYRDAAKSLIFPSCFPNVSDSIDELSRVSAISALDVRSNARLLLCTSLTLSSMSMHFSCGERNLANLVFKEAQLAIDMLTHDAKHILKHSGVSAVKASILSALPSDLLEASKQLFLSPNVLSFLLTLVGEYLFFANIACHFMKVDCLEILECNFVKSLIEGLQDVLSLLVNDQLNEEWVNFYRILILHDFSKQIVKLKKRFHFCDRIADAAISLTPDVVCIEDFLNLVADVVYSFRCVGDLDSTNILLDQVFYWETTPFNVQSDMSYQSTYRNLFHLELVSLNKATDSDKKGRAMIRLARVIHWMLASTHNECYEQSRFLQCVNLDSPELTDDLSAIVKVLYECGTMSNCPLAVISDVIDLSTFSNKNEAGLPCRPISVTNLELILKDHFYRSFPPSPNNMFLGLISKRNYSACLFVQLWGMSCWGNRNSINDNILMKNIWSEFIKLNGSFNEQSRTWMKGQHEHLFDLTKIPFGLEKDDDVLVFSRPGDMDWAETRTPPVIPSLLRRKFADIDEANVELGDDELFLLQPVYGTVVFIDTSHQSQLLESGAYCSGFVCEEGSGVYLPFCISTEYEFKLLESNGKAPFLYQRCSFYVGFSCKKVFGFLIQSAVDNNDRISYFDMLQAERICLSNNPLYQPRLIRERPFRPRITVADGLNFLEYSLQTSPCAEISKAFNLTDSDYADLLTDYKQTNSVPIQLLSSKEFNVENVESMVGLQKHIYGRLNYLCSALLTPYESFDVLPNKSTGWVACPVSRSAGAGDLKSIFPWIDRNVTDPGYLDKQIHWIARDVISLFVDKAAKFGASKPTRKVVPQKMDVYESATETYCRKMFVFVSLPKLSLVAAPNGILVLREQSQSGTGHFFDLGILYFHNRSVTDIRNYIISIWRRSVGCIISSKWQYLGDFDPVIDDSVENSANKVMENVEEPNLGANLPSLAPAVSPTNPSATSIFNVGANTVAPSLSIASVQSGNTPSTGIGPWYWPSSERDEFLCLHLKGSSNNSRNLLCHFSWTCLRRHLL